ncbi:TPA: hypothetical protein ACH3X3_004903 [Trebouxia sp. C0006]
MQISLEVVQFLAQILDLNVNVIDSASADSGGPRCTAMKMLCFGFAMPIGRLQACKEPCNVHNIRVPRLMSID